MKLRLLTVLMLIPGLAFAASTAADQEFLQAQLSPQDPGVLILAPVPTEKLLADDALLDGKHGVPLRYGVVQSVTGVSLDASAASAGKWTTLADGSLHWQLDVEAQGANTLEFAFSELRLPHGAKLWLRSLDRKHVVGPLTDADNRADGRYRSTMLEGSHARLELSLPAAKRAYLALSLDKIVYGYRDPLAAQELQKSGSCNIDVACPQGAAWRDQSASVAHYTFQRETQTFLCTGTLMATGNRSQDLAEPRFSTAHHCINTAAEAQSMVFYWGYESQTCRAPGSSASGTRIPLTGNNRASQSGASLLATHEATDFTAVQLTTAVPTAATAYYSGWDRSGATPSGSVGIHHPAGHEKRITFNTDPLTTSPSCIVDGLPSSTTHWRIEQYEDGTTEGGSSGSGLWNPSNQLFIGVLSGGDASCANPGGFDCYGRLSAAWEAGTAPASRMRDWFDRSGTNPQTVAGMAVCVAPTVTLDSPAFVTAPAAGQTVQLSATASGGAAGARTYSWDVDGDGAFDRVGSASAISITYPKAQAAQVRLRVQDSAGCAVTITRALDVVGATLTATPGTPAQVCGDNDAAIEPGERWKVPVILRNTGTVALPAGARALFAPGAASSGVLPIGPNTFGYRATTSAAGGCGYDFIDLASGANAVPILPVANPSTPADLIDDVRTQNPIALGGTGLRLYGQTYTQAIMSSNGYVSLSTLDTGGDFSNDCAGGYNNGAAGPQLRAHHDDLVIGALAGAGLRYRYFASCPRSAESDRGQAQGCHVFQWSRMQLYTSSTTPPSGDFEFEAIAYERTGQVSYQFRSAAPDAGAHSTIGISNPAGNDPLNAGCDDAGAAPALSAVCVFDPSALPSASSGLRLEAATVSVAALTPSQQVTVDAPIALTNGASCGAPLALDYIGTATPGSFSLDTKLVLNTSVGNGGACQTSTACPAQIPSIATRPGFYFSGTRPGNGLANFVYGDIYGGVWYTALADRSPTWYILNGGYADHLGAMPISRFRNTGAPSGFDPVSETVGRAWVAQIDNDSLLYAWTLDDGLSGAELLDATPLPFTTPNHSQTWYATNESGWGLSIESLLAGPGNFLEFMVGYIYDASGDARWVLGTSNSITGGSADLSTYQVHCPACPWFSDWDAAPQAAGTLSRTYTGSVNATFNSTITLPAPLSGSWNRSNLPITTIGPPAAKSQD